MGVGRPEAKAVVFSQWVRTHELIIRRLKKRGWDYVGLKLIETLAASPPPKGMSIGGGHEKSDKSGAWIETDGASGRSILKQPLPEPTVLQQITVALSRLLATLGR